MSKAEVILIMILFHDSGYRCFKHFYLENVCKYLRHLFPKVVSYNRLVELERDVVIPLTLFIKKVLLGKSIRVMSEKVCKILLVLALMLGVPQAWGQFVMLIFLCHFTIFSTPQNTVAVLHMSLLFSPWQQIPIDKLQRREKASPRAWARCACNFDSVVPPS